MTVSKGITLWETATTGERDAIGSAIGLQIGDLCSVRGDSIYRCTVVNPSSSTWLSVSSSGTINPIDTSGMTGVVLNVDAEGDLTDASGNGYNLLATISPKYLEIDGKLGLWSRASQSIVMVSGVGDYVPLKLYGAMTLHALVHANDQESGSSSTIANFSGTGETEATNTLYSVEILTTGQLSIFHEHGAGVDDRTTIECGLPVGRWSLFTLTRGVSSGVDCKAYLNGTEIHAWNEPDVPSGASAAQFKFAGFIGLWGGVVICNVEQNAAAVLAVAQQVGVA